jgi:hypothetical protein
MDLEVKKLHLLEKNNTKPNRSVYVIAFVSPGQLTSQTKAFRSGCRPTHELSWFLQASRQIIMKLKFLPSIELWKNTYHTLLAPGYFDG